MATQPILYLFMFCHQRTESELVAHIGVSARALTTKVAANQRANGIA